MLEEARRGLAAYPDALKTLRDQLMTHDPLGIVATFAAYGLRSYVSNDGVEAQKGLDILQHHAELLQAIMLGMPVSQWGAEPITPPVMQVVFDTVPILTDAFQYNRILEGAETKEKAQLLVRSLQARIALHTQGVRNWGYFAEVVSLSKKLFGPLDPSFRKHFGFAASDLIFILQAVVAEFERRQSEHFSVLKKVNTGKNTRQMARNYYKYVPGLEGTPDAFVTAMNGASREQVMVMIMSHFDLRLADRATFTSEQLAELTGVSEPEVRAAMKAISLAPGDLASEKPEYLFLTNPVWERPLIDLGESFFIPVPQMAFSHIHRIMDRLCEMASQKVQLSKVRARFLENELVETLKRALPGSEIRSGVKWSIDDQQFETDVLLTIDRTIVIAEAKSARLTQEGLRGAPDRVKRHVTDLVLAPSIQSERLAKLIDDAKSGDAAAMAVATKLELAPDKIDRVIRLSVTLDDMSVLTSAEVELKEAGWVPPDHDLAPALLISDLGCVADILTNPIQVLHYLSERSFFQKVFDLLGDELDFLGLYLVTGFNLAAIQRKEMQFVPSGMSAPLDQYYTSRDAGINIPKPKVKLGKAFTRIIEQLATKRPPGWTTIGLYLLACADPGEQAEVDRKLDELRGMVRKNYRDPKHINSLQIHPPERRKAGVLFFVFPGSRRDSMREDMEQLAAEFLEGTDLDACVLIGKSADRWDAPYEALLLVHSQR